MKREVKFRGKDIETNQWLYGNLIKRLGYFPSIMYDYESQGKVHYAECAVNRDSIGQYIGIEDKNGVEIYEGDILRSDKYPFSNVEDGVYDNYLVEVCWDEECCCFFGYVFKHPSSNVYGISEGDTVECENFDSRGLYVIGNINDNPELINKEVENE